MVTKGKDNRAHFDYYIFISYIITACAFVGMVVLFAEGRHFQGLVLYLFSAAILQLCRQIGVTRKLRSKGDGKTRLSEILNEIYVKVRIVQESGDKAFGENVPKLFKRAMPYLMFLFLVSIYHINLLLLAVVTAVTLHLIT